MGRLLVLGVAALALAGCGGGTAGDVANLATSTPGTAALAVAEANAASAGTAMASYFAQNGSYAGATPDTLRALDAGLSPTVSVTATATSYCVQSVVDGATASLRGPGTGAPTAGAC